MSISVGPPRYFTMKVQLAPSEKQGKGKKQQVYFSLHFSHSLQSVTDSLFFYKFRTHNNIIRRFNQFPITVSRLFVFSSLSGMKLYLDVINSHYFFNRFHNEQ